MDSDKGGGIGEGAGMDARRVPGLLQNDMQVVPADAERI